MEELSFSLSGWQLAPGTHAPGEASAEPAWTPLDRPRQWQTVPGFEQHTGPATYRATLDLQPDAGRSYRLVIPGVFYFVRVSLNGAFIGFHEGYFERREMEVTPWLREHNEFVFEVSCPEEKNLRKKHLILGVFGHWDCRDPKAHPGGFWQAPVVTAHGPARLRELGMTTRELGMTTREPGVTGAAGDWQILLEYRHLPPLQSTPPPKWATLELSLEDPDSGAAVWSEVTRVALKEGCQPLAGAFTVPDPKLWWCHDHGPSPLYTLRAVLKDDSGVLAQSSLKTGIRTLRWDDYRLYLNGRSVYARGTNYGPADAWLSEVTEERLAGNLELVRGANLNMIRVHAHVSPPGLYEHCDRFGILIWQDFPLIWSYKLGILEEARRQILILQRQLRHHPSVVAWAVHNEPFDLYRTHPQTPLSLFRIVRSNLMKTRQDLLDWALARDLRKADPLRKVIRASGIFAKPWGGTDTHPYVGWYFGTMHMLRNFIRRTPRNGRWLSEFGAQGAPVRENTLKFMPEDLAKADWPLLEERFMAQKELLWKYAGTPTSLDDFIDRTQRYQSLYNKFFIETLRLRKYAPSCGFQQFFFNDGSPGISWSLVDYWGTPKPAYRAVAESCEPLQILFEHEGRPYKHSQIYTVRFFAINDLQSPHENIPVWLEILDPEGNSIQRTRFTANFTPDMLPQEVFTTDFVPVRIGWYEVRTRMEISGREITNGHRLEVKL